MMIVFGLVATENILANFVLIPWLSLNGAALNTSISTVLVAVGLVASTRQAAGQLDWGRVLGGPTLAALAAAAGMFLLRDSLPASVVAGAIVYLVVLFLFERLLFPDDAKAVFDLLPRRA